MGQERAGTSGTSGSPHTPVRRPAAAFGGSSPTQGASYAGIVQLGQENRRRQIRRPAWQQGFEVEMGPPRRNLQYSPVSSIRVQGESQEVLARCGEFLDTLGINRGRAEDQRQGTAEVGVAVQEEGEAAEEEEEIASQDLRRGLARLRSESPVDEEVEEGRCSEEGPQGEGRGEVLEGRDGGGARVQGEDRRSEELQHLPSPEVDSHSQEIRRSVARWRAAGGGGEAPQVQQGLTEDAGVGAGEEGVQAQPQPEQTQPAGGEEQHEDLLSLVERANPAIPPPLLYFTLFSIG